jgi:hypothetical protein
MFGTRTRRLLLVTFYFIFFFLSIPREISANDNSPQTQRPCGQPVSEIPEPGKLRKRLENEIECFFLSNPSFRKTRQLPLLDRQLINSKLLNNARVYLRLEVAAGNCDIDQI